MSDRLEIVPLTKPPTATVRVPGSKSITNRALVLTALASKGRECFVRGALRSEDTEVMVEALRTLGFRVRVDWSKATIHVRRGDHASPIPAKEANLFVANSGTSMRFLTALVSLGQGHYRLDGVSRSARAAPHANHWSEDRRLQAAAGPDRGLGHSPRR